jgi:hypothetical protein
VAAKYNRMQMTEEIFMSDQPTKNQEQSRYEPPVLLRHGKLAEVTQTSPPDALDSTMRPTERRHRPEEPPPADKT